MPIEFDGYRLRDRLVDHPDWLGYIDPILAGNSMRHIHLAVFSEPYLSYLLAGKKTIESRFSRVKCAPYRRIAEGDVILIKESGGPVRAVTIAQETTFYHFEKDCLDQLKQRYALGICADDAFWLEQESALYATIIVLGDTLEVEPMNVGKRDRRGWVPLMDTQLSFLF